ncbi:MAG: hypothetical protein MUC47_01025 [Candidatus Kapabacteria bacterium]|jgi:hypothetical protein|nr:hypothetical protein [Candidatus Kapabacteria bacterium]
MMTIMAGAGILACIVVACGTTRPIAPAPCLSPALHDLVIQWGTEDDSTRRIEAWELSSKGEVEALVGTHRDSLQRSYVGALASQDYCQRVDAIKAAYLQTQAMNVRGTRARFVSYSNASGNVYLRVVWNPDLQTFQSRVFRAEYDSLMALLERLD